MSECKEKEYQKPKYEKEIAAVIHEMWTKLGDSTLSLTYLAKIAQYSPFHFDRIFRSLTGIPPRQFLSAIRMEQAKEYLMTTDLPVTEISLRVGYSSFGTFSTRFSRVVGLSPQQFRTYMEQSKLELQRIVGLTQNEQDSVKGGIVGHISCPDSFQGFMCIGLFEKPIPIGKPVMCTVAFEEGRFWLPPVPDGDYYLMATAFTWDEPLGEYFLPRHTLRGKSKEVLQIRGQRMVKEAPPLIRLRKPQFFDPPILISLPVLLEEYLNQEDAIRKRANEKKPTLSLSGNLSIK
ncbi:MAG TPA: helix-turn-helix transcriptional regulator [Candidatus Bathyarchaeia archaeon]|nr:helix-turn-helix transcriptional regulator [Candidatus Bathyarchaeia archaeon]